jgi:NAD(P)H-flavin reductase
MIMIAAGAGLAPLRAFLQERQYLKDQGATLAPAHLYFGVTHPDQVLARACLTHRHAHPEYCYERMANTLFAVGVVS